MGMTIQVTSLVCTGCATVLEGSLFRGNALAHLSLTQGKCPSCGKDRFRATLTRTMSGYQPPSTDEILFDIAFSTRTSGGHQVTWDDVFELPEVQSDELFARLSRSPESVSEWITSLRKEEAKAHLRPDQRLCATCGEIFTVELVGYTREGYCSPLCRKKGLGAFRSSEPADSAPGKVESCARCGRPVRPKPGAICMHCGADL